MVSVLFEMTFICLDLKVDCILKLVRVYFSHWLNELITSYLNHTGFIIQI